ncbi:unnamed protein product, partial [Adineta steineri]
MSPPKRLRYEESRQIMNPISQRIIAQTTFECFTSAENTTRPFTVSTDIKMMDNSCNDQSSCLTMNNDNTLSSSSINNSTKTTSSSSIEQTLSMTPTKISTTAHRFASRKIFKPETCFV